MINAMFHPPVTLKKPIFLVGCAKSGTTVAGFLFTFHPEIGPKVRQQREYQSLQEFVNDILDLNVHGVIADEMEYKSIWDRYFPMNAKLRIGKELTLLENPLSGLATKALMLELTKDFQQDRFFSKQPFNSFRVHVLRELWPDAKILAIHRDGRDVISSWGREGGRWDAFGGMENAIEVFASKWNETVDHIERYKDSLDIETFHFEELVRDTEGTMERLCRHCEIPYLESVYSGIKLKSRIGVWEERISKNFHSQVCRLTHRNLERLGYLS